MKAVVFTRYGSPDVLQLRQIAKPALKDDEVLIKVHATTVTMGDCEIRSSRFPLWLWPLIRIWIGVFRPRKKVLGQELAGEVEAVGKSVTRFQKGESIFASTGMHLGSYAEYVVLPEAPEEGVLAAKPANMTYAEAAALPVGGLIAWDFLSRATIQAGQKVLINGAGGSIGTYAVQIAKVFGAEVTSVDSTAKLDMLRTIGSDHVIDYTQDDFTRSGVTYDVIFDIVGKSPFSRSLKSLQPDGRYLLANPGLSYMLRGAWVSRSTNQKVIFTAPTPKPEDITELQALIEAGQVKTVIDRYYPLEQTADAHRYVDTGRKQGNVIITLAHQS